MNIPLILQYSTEAIEAHKYTFSWTHIAIGITVAILLFNLIAFHIGFIIKLVLAAIIIGAAYYFIYYV